MIRSDAATRLGLLKAITAVSVIPDVTHDPSEFTPGARVQARVEAQLAGGGFRVVVADTPMQMRLPPGIRPGTTLELMFIGGKPRPTFVLLNPPAPTGSNALLSPAARLLVTLAQDAGTSSVTTPPYQATPVLEKPPGDTGEFGTRLQQAFSQGGLFYESHQAQWLTGRRTLEQLLREPQGRLSRMAPQGKPDAAPAAPPPGKPDVADSTALSQAIARAEAASAEAPANPERLFPKEALPLVQQQLATLDTGQMLWRGEVWPGQTLDWEVDSEPPEQDDSEEPLRWRSRLRLTMPLLGQVTALLMIDARGVRIEMGAASASAVETLRGGQASLIQAMRGSGLNVSGIEVQRDGDA